MISFETGPIRPPSEAGSILIRLTRNCPWNKCTFCPVYKGQKFSRRSVEEIKADIDAITIIRDVLQEKFSRAEGGKFGDTILRVISGHQIAPEFINQVYFWMHSGLENVFLQDADSLVLKTAHVAEVLRYLKAKIPSVKRITTYSRAKTVSRKSTEELRELKDAGLNRLHLGMESGSDDVLQFMKKGVTAEEHISAGKKAVAAGMELSEYYMPGLGGKMNTRQNAEDSARVLNEINPAFIRLRSTVPVPGTPLYDLMEKGAWAPLTEEEKIKEIRLFLEKLEGINSILLSDHIMNMIEDIGGKLPGDKDKMLGIADTFLGMSIEDRESFMLGRRLGKFHYFSDYKKIPNLDEIKKQVIERYSSLDEALKVFAQRYI